MAETQAITPESQQPIHSASIPGAAEQDGAVETSGLDSGQPGLLPEKFRGPNGISEMAKAYQEAERTLRKVQEEKSQFAKEAERAKALEQQLWAMQMQAQQPVYQNQIVDEAEQFRNEWLEDPVQASYNQTKRVEAKAAMAMQDYATNLFYQQAKLDTTNYPDFDKYEPTMVRLAQDRELLSLVDPSKLRSPAVIKVLYNLARANHQQEEIRAAKESGVREAEKLKRNKSAAFAESSSPSGGNTKSFDDMSLKEMEDLLGFVER